MSSKKPDYEAVLDILKTELDKRSNGYNGQIDLLSDILLIDRSNIRRRLNGSTMLSADELIRICSALDIPLAIFEGAGPDKPVLLELLSFDLGGGDQVISYLERGRDFFRKANENNDSALWLLSQIIPYQIYMPYLAVLEFYMLKWLYHSQKYDDIHARAAVLLGDTKFLETIAEYLRTAREMYETVLILREDMVPSIVREIIFFHDIGVVGKEDIHRFRTDLEAMISYLEESAGKGTWAENDNRLSIFVGHINHTNSIMTVESSAVNMTIFGVNYFNIIAGEDKECVGNNKNWMKSFIRTSEHISVTGEKRRREFLRVQRQALRELDI